MKPQNIDFGLISNALLPINDIPAKRCQKVYDGFLQKVGTKGGQLKAENGLYFGLRHMKSQSMVTAFESEFSQRLNSYNEFSPLNELELIHELSDLNESIEGKDYDKEEKLKSLCEIKTKMESSEANEDAASFSSEKLRKLGLNSTELSSGRWTSEEILMLIKSILLFGESAGFAKAKTVKRTIAEKKLKWMSLKH